MDRETALKSYHIKMNKLLSKYFYHDAEKVLMSFISQFPNDLEAQALLVYVRLIKGRTGGADKVLEYLNREFSELPFTEIANGYYCVSTGRFHDATNYFKKALNIRDTAQAEFVARYNLALLEKDARAMADVLEDYLPKRALPRAVLHRRLFAVFQYLSNDPEGALRTIQRGLAHSKVSGDTHVIIGEIQRALGKPWLALKEYTEAITLFSGRVTRAVQLPRVLWCRAMAYFEVEDFPAAGSDLLAAVALEMQRLESHPRGLRLKTNEDVEQDLYAALFEPYITLINSIPEMYSRAITKHHWWDLGERFSPIFRVDYSSLGANRMPILFGTMRFSFDFGLIPLEMDTRELKYAALDIAHPYKPAPGESGQKFLERILQTKLKGEVRKGQSVSKEIIYKIIEIYKNERGEEPTPDVVRKRLSRGGYTKERVSKETPSA